jgi:hypothetical protein
VCVYCASGPRHPELLDLARRVGEAIAGRGWTLVSGGGNVSAMGAVAAGARAVGGHTVGVIPKALLHREVADVDSDELVGGDSVVAVIARAITGSSSHGDGRKSERHLEDSLIPYGSQIRFEEFVPTKWIRKRQAEREVPPMLQWLPVLQSARMARPASIARRLV